MRVQIRTRTFVHDANLSESEVARESRNWRGGGTSKCRNRVQIRTRIHKGEGEPTMVWGRASTISGCEYECSRLRLHDDQSELVRARVKWRWRHEGKRVGEGGRGREQMRTRHCVMGEDEGEGEGEGASSCRPRSVIASASSWLSCGGGDEGRALGTTTALACRSCLGDEVREGEVGMTRRRRRRRRSNAFVSLW